MKKKRRKMKNKKTPSPLKQPATMGKQPAALEGF
jgi:hypothetical protein